MRPGLAAAAAALAMLGAPAPARTGAALRDEVALRGSRAVLEDDFNLDGGRGYRTVAAGSPEAIEVAVQLLTTVADAGYAEGLQSALGSALQRHPGAVLPLVGTQPLLAADRICLPFVDAESGRIVVRRVLARTRAALDRDEARRYPAQRAACLAVVDAASGAGSTR